MSKRFCGYSEYFHDAGIAFVGENGDILGAHHAERFSGIKFSANLTDEMYDMIEDDDHVTFYEDHSLRERTRRKKFNPGMLPSELGLRANFLYGALTYDDFCTHHESHASMAFYTRPWESSDDTVILTIDGVGEAESTMIYDSNFNVLDRWTAPKSVGLLYTKITKIIGLKPMEDEYITMGLSAYGEPVLGQELVDLVNSFTEYDPDDPSVMTNQRNKEFDKFSKFIGENLKLEKYRQEDLAASAQYMAEKIIYQRAKRARQFGSKLCYGGGVAQNVVANSLIRDMFDEVWIAPSPTDAGSALGCAARSYHKHTGRNRINWIDSFIGYDIDREINPSEVAQYLIDNKVCGVANGAAEYGPRALGNRSLLADVRYDVKDTVNDIKRRQRYRPFAPAVLEEYADKYFEGHMNEYMQYQAKALHDYSSVTHVDGTARVQVVKKNSRSVLRKILEEYHDRTGVPMLLNTSLNIRGKPMVNDERHAEEWQKKYQVKVF